MARPYALLRAGFPYLKTLGTLVITGFPTDVAVTRDMRVFVLRRYVNMGAMIAKTQRWTTTPNARRWRSDSICSSTSTTTSFFRR